MKSKNTQKVAVIGAGPVGIAAAAHLLEQGIQPLVFEKGSQAGSSMLEWGHVRIFTPWKYITDKAVVALLEKAAWQHPEEEHLPSGREIVEQYLLPAAATPELQPAIIYNANVTSVTKAGHSKSSLSNRDESPYTIHYEKAGGQHLTSAVTAVIDASGSWSNPNPIGSDGIPVPGEVEHRDRIQYGIPDVLHEDRNRYASKKTLVLGGGHSAINTVLGILKLRTEYPDTQLVWGLRNNTIDKLLGGGINDELPARGELGLAAKEAIDNGSLSLLAPFSVQRIAKTDNGSLKLEALVDGTESSFEVDRIVVATGFRPNLDMLRELRLDIDQVVEAPATLAPLIDPDLHSCGTVPPHGVEELIHRDGNFYIAGMKAYGRAPTFLLPTGYGQVRSIAAGLAGDHEAARQINLVLPTGVYSSDRSASGGGCCTSSSPVTKSAACCEVEADPHQCDDANTSCGTQNKETAYCNA